MTSDIFKKGLRWGIGLSLVMASHLMAQGLEVKPDAPSTYTVVKGDTLWDISGRYLDQPWRWPELWGVNPQIENPHLIYPGDVITLYYQDGQPRLGLNVADRPGGSDGVGGQGRTPSSIRLSPQIRSKKIDSAIPVIPIEDIQQLLRNLRAFDRASIVNTPYVVGAPQGRIISAEGERIYVKGLTQGHEQYDIYHISEAIYDPDTKERLAYEGIHVGTARLDKFAEPATLIVTGSSREIVRGDRLIPMVDIQTGNFYPRPSPGRITGKIISVVDGVGIIGRYQTVIINVGLKHGITRGDVFSAFSKPTTVLDVVSAEPGDSVELPATRSGTLMVVQPFQKLSYALVMESRLPLRLYDEVRSPSP